MKSFKGIILGAGLAIAMLSACTTSQESNLTVSKLDPAKFEKTIDGKPVKLYVLKNSKGMEACITNYGGRVVSLMVPDKDGNMTDVVLGYDNIDQYADTLNLFQLLGRANPVQDVLGGHLSSLVVDGFHPLGLPFIGTPVIDHLVDA